MISKIKNILSSVRFWEVLVGVVLYILVAEGAITNDSAVAVVQGIYTVLGISVTIGTVDTVFKK